MENQKKENGYTPIANEIMEALAGIRIPGVARQCLDVILRKTYGWNKNEDIISLSQFAVITHLGKGKICQALDKLRQMNIVITQKGNMTGNKHRLNKDFSTWRPLPKKVTITQKGNKSLPKKGHTKETIQKQYIYSPSLEENKDGVAEKFLGHYMTKFAEYVSKKKKPVHSKTTILPKIDLALNELGEERLKELLEIYMQSKDKFYEQNLWSLTCFLSPTILTKLHVGNK